MLATYINRCSRRCRPRRGARLVQGREKAPAQEASHSGRPATSGFLIRHDHLRCHSSLISTPCFLAARRMRFLIFLTSSASYLAALSLWLM
jgi:hypothetical protein